MKITQQILRDKKEHIEKNHGILHCITCREEYTANAADYWAVPMDYVFYCCGIPMVLVKKETKFTKLI